LDILLEKYVVVWMVKEKVERLEHVSVVWRAKMKATELVERSDA
jgi:hypothetical protein